MEYGITERVTFITLDGTEHPTYQAAVDYQIERDKRGEKRLADYKKTFNYRQLIAKHNLDSEGVWEVLGEDPNCDLAGPHHQPYLGTFSGKLRTCIEMAVNLDGFWQWGSGGSIRKIEVKHLEN